MILIKPVISEKSLKLASANQYTFRVNRKATKYQIKNAVQNQFNVSVLKVNTSQTKSSTHRSFRTGKKITQKAKKTAFVSLKKGQTIKLFETKK